MTQENPQVPPELYRRTEFKRDARRFRVVTEDGDIHATGVRFSSGRAVVEEVADPSVSSRLDVYPGERGVEDLRDDLDEAEVVEWVDYSRRVREGDAVVCPKCESEVPVEEWTVYRHGGGECPLCNYDALPDRVRLHRDDGGRDP